MLLIELGTIIVSTIASLLIFGVIIMTSDISEGESHGMNSRNSSRVSNQSGKGRYSAQTMRMLKRNIRRRWLEYKQLSLFALHYAYLYCLINIAKISIFFEL